ncbi:DUF2087 domain-containing protein [Glycomyces algeriensis]|uniref:DUF2087 domain-containing protein n=1 Tax=Glycomyces algeriensis TaxID=256037 RepID=A0A9W6GBM2_9ACTN|nr:DUF2087 domain-containing protein [Glycomyces algeriensis]MDA1365396.1 DUF2087 domain-containing protein [Glycomyces algeriensis]MDR7351081.1 hypothetical protein [Glycomyces algeriensis]GLI43794.1 hypothetical protein GALLR39Z86_36440 [Glycomyces algeriensis]
MEPSHLIVKALADPERLRVFADIVLTDSGTTVTDLRARHPRAEKALVRLFEAGLVTREDGKVRAAPDAFKDAAAAARAAAPAAPPGVSPEVAQLYSNGRVSVMPVNRRTRVALLRDIAGRRFAFDRVYTEAEVTETLAAEYHDPLQLRRDMVDELLLERTLGGREYRRREAPPI